MLDTNKRARPRQQLPRTSCTRRVPSITSTASSPSADMLIFVFVCARELQAGGGGGGGCGCAECAAGPLSRIPASARSRRCISNTSCCSYCASLGVARQQNIAERLAFEWSTPHIFHAHTTHNTSTPAQQRVLLLRLAAHRRRRPRASERQPQRRHAAHKHRAPQEHLGGCVVLGEPTTWAAKKTMLWSNNKLGMQRARVSVQVELHSSRARGVCVWSSAFEHGEQRQEPMLDAQVLHEKPIDGATWVAADALQLNTLKSWHARHLKVDQRSLLF